MAWVTILRMSRGRSPPPELSRAVDEFNDQAFWECHETLEDLWLKTPYPLRFFYHSIIKVAVGLHHLGLRNRHGARTKLADGVRLLRLFQPTFLTLRTDSLLHDTSEWLARVDGRLPIDWVMLDSLAWPNIQLDAAGEA